MAISDVYTANATGFSNATAAATPILSVIGTAAKRLWIVGCRVEIVTTSATAGGNTQFQLVRSTTATITATGTSAGVAHDASAPASIGIFASTWSTAPAGTLVVLAEWTIPQTAGSAWEEFPPLGYEWGVPAIANAASSCGVHLFATNAQAVATTYNAEIIWSE